MERIKGLVVTLEENLPEEDFERLKGLLRQIKGVLDVEGVPANPLDDHIIAQRVRSEIKAKLWAQMQEI